MSRYSAPIAVIFLIFAFSCSNSGRIRDSAVSDVALNLPRERETPVLRILDYENMAENAALSPWIREYLENDISVLESSNAYQNSYLFVSSIRAAKKPVIDQWAANYNPERDFPRLVAERIQKRLHRDLPGIAPDALYGLNYDKTIRAAYQYGFWGAERLDDTWIYALPAAETEEPENPLFWGFILLSIPRETLEIQVMTFLSGIEDTSTGRSRAVTREQNDAFDEVKQRFFERF